MDERRHGSLSPSRVSLQSLSEPGARQLQKQTSRSLLAAETRTVAASSSARATRHFLQDSIQKLYEFQEPGDEHHHASVATDAASLQQKKGAKRPVLLQEIEHHLQDDFQLFLWGGDTFCGQTDRGVHLLPRVVKNGLQNALLVCEVLDELGLTCPCQTADGRGAGALVAALGEKGLSCLADPLAARRQNSSSLGSRCPHALPLSSPTDSSWLQKLFS